MNQSRVVAGFLLRPLLDLAVLAYLCDIQALAVVGWLVDRRVPVASLR